MCSATGARSTTQTSSRRDSADFRDAARKRRWALYSALPSRTIVIPVGLVVRSIVANSLPRARRPAYASVASTSFHVPSTVWRGGVGTGNGRSRVSLSSVSVPAELVRVCLAVKRPLASAVTLAVAVPASLIAPAATHVPVCCPGADTIMRCEIIRRGSSGEVSSLQRMPALATLLRGRDSRNAYREVRRRVTAGRSGHDVQVRAQLAQASTGGAYPGAYLSAETGRLAGRFESRRAHCSENRETPDNPPGLLGRGPRWPASDPGHEDLAFLVA
jgi:hypothetical protein